MRGYRIGVINEPWIDFEPPISGGTFNLNDPEKATQPLSPPVSIREGDRACNGTEKHLSAEGIKYLASVDRNADFITNKTPWLERKAAVAETLKQRTSDFQPAGLIDHAAKLEVDLDLSELPSLDAETQRNISISFRKLHQRVREHGLHECKLSNYFTEFIRYSILFASFIYAFKCEWYITSAVFLGLFWHQIMFVAHDAGHLAITSNFKIDTIIGIIVADFCCGLSIGWWKSSHNVHHLVPNHPVCVLFRHSHCWMATD